jgi:ADP-heptose:LPS heptosyltransferase
MSRCLAIFHKQLGDLVLLEPTLKRLARASGSSVDLITRSGFQPLISLMPHVNYRRTPSRRAYEGLWCFDDRKKSAFYALVSEARQKHLLINPGAPIQWYHPKIFHQIFAPDLGSSHIAEYYWRNTVVDSSHNFQPPELQSPPEEWAYPLLSKNYLHVNPTSGRESKNWTPEKWARTINRLQESGISPIVMTSGKQEWQKKHCEMICLQLNRSIENVRGETSMKNYLSIIWNAKTVLTPDGSASHIAAAFRRKCVTLFGPTDATHWHRETAYSQAIVTGNIIGKRFPRLKFLPEEPVIEAVIDLWTSKEHKGGFN